MSDKKSVKEFRIKVKRYNPETSTFSVSEYVVGEDRYATVLSALLDIKQQKDPTLSVRYSCRMGVCGSCGMRINGKPSLACETNLFSLGSEEVFVEAMEGHPVLRDLVTDFDDFFEKHATVKPWLLRKDEEEKFKTEKEYPQSIEELDYYRVFANCIKCGLCVDACPVSNTNKGFLGPQALAQAYRYSADSRDEGAVERLGIVDTLEGAWGCEFAGSCSKACPKGVDPALAIQLLKSEIMIHRLTKRLPERKIR